MKKTWQIILIHLCAHVLFGMLILMSGFNKLSSDGPLSGYGMVLLYIITPIALISSPLSYYYM